MAWLGGRNSVAAINRTTGLGTHLDSLRLNPLALSPAGVLFDPIAGSSYTLSPVAVAIIVAWQAGNSPDRIKALLLERFEVSARTLDRDLSDFMRALKRLGLAI